MSATYFTTNLAPSGRTPTWRAARKGLKQWEMVYDVVKAAGSDGITKANVVAKLPGIKGTNIAYYLNDLVKKGVLEQKGGIGPRVASAPPPPKPVTASEARLIAMAALEDALVAKVKEQKGATTEQSEAFAKYQKLKALAINGGATPGESESAYRFALVALVKLVW